MNNLRKYKFEIFLILILSLNFFLIFQIFGFTLGGDFAGYVEPISFLAGKTELNLSLQELGRLFLRPLGLIIGSFLAFFTDAYSAMILEDLIFYLATPFLIFFAAYYFFKQKRPAFYAAIFYASAYPYLKFTINYMTDVGAWFFLVLSICLTLKYLSIYKSNPGGGKKILLLNPVLCFLGFLIKEDGGLGIGFLVLAILLATDLRLKEKIKNILITSFLFLALMVIYQIIFYNAYHYQFFSLFSTAADSYSARNYNFGSVAKKLTALFSIGWVFIAFGFFRIFKSKDRQKKMILLALIPTSFSFLLWPYQAERLMFVAGPLLSLLAAAGINMKKDGFKCRFLEGVLIIIFIGFNYLTDYLIINFDLLFFL